MRHSHLKPHPRRRGEWRRDRRGITLVMVAITMTVLLGFAGVGFDFARAYASRTQVKTVADAAAMAGAIKLMTAAGRANGQPETEAINYAPLNTVEGGHTATVTDADVEAVQWDFNTRTVVARFGNDYTAAGVNAIEVTARYSMPTTFGRVFNVTQIPIRERTVAALGGVGTQNCLRPWAVHYRALLNQLDAAFPLPGGGTRPNSYNLTQADINFLSSNNVLTTFLQNNDDPTSPGNIAQVATWKESYAAPSSGAAYHDAIAGTIPCDQMRELGPGDPLPPKPGAGTGQTRDAVRDFCVANGGVTGNANGANKPVDCTGLPPVKLILYTEDTGGGGATQSYIVKTVGVFKLKGFDPPNNNTSTHPCLSSSTTYASMCGYFSTMSSNGAFTGGIGMTQKPAIVL